ncbi:MAG: hypothetical protein IPJ65_21850 [Archangiaceae bacterium]|nr:hypothetical protein [Archangiaceae bacterium]
MKRVGSLVVLLVALTVGGEARAQGGYNPGGAVFDALIAPVLLAETIALSGAALTSGGVLHGVKKGQPHLGWIIASLATSVVNLGAGAFWAWGANEWAHSSDGPEGTALFGSPAAVHLGAAALSIVSSTVGLMVRRDPASPTVIPVVLLGKSPGGRRWLGLVIQVANL